MKYDDSSFYLICRGTKSRQSIIANDFNMKDSMITHIGIGYVKENSLIVFNVSTPVNDEEKSALVVENFDSFTNMKDINYVSIWKSESNAEEMTRLKSILDYYQTRIIKFDGYFRLLDDNEYYCSEFVSKILKDLNPEKYNFTPIKKELNLFYSKALKRNTFEYIPVDFFLVFDTIVKVYEKKFY